MFPIGLNDTFCILKERFKNTMTFTDILKVRELTDLIAERIWQSCARCEHYSR
jgi:hypothetical protein